MLYHDIALARRPKQIVKSPPSQIKRCENVSKQSVKSSTIRLSELLQFSTWNAYVYYEKAKMIGVPHNFLNFL